MFVCVIVSEEEEGIEGKELNRKRFDGWMTCDFMMGG